MQNCEYFIVCYLIVQQVAQIRIILYKHFNKKKEVKNMREYENPIIVDELIEKFKNYNNNQKDIELINKAFDYAYLKHFGVKRITGDDYITPQLRQVRNDNNGRNVEVFVPLLPARAKDKEGYIKEFESIGFTVEKFVEMDVSSAIAYSASIYIRKTNRE